MNPLLLLLLGLITSLPSIQSILPPSSTNPHIRVAYQGVPGAYSEKSTRELLGPHIISVGHPNFESCYRAVADGDCDYCVLPIENSLGGSIHEVYDLMLRYDLTIVGEHEFRVKHCFLAKEGVTRDDVKYAISHPQALAQCDGYLRALGIEKIPVYDTAGAAKMIAEGKGLPGGCTPENTAAVASDLAGRTYGLNCLQEGIEDDDSNFTRFLLLGRQSVARYMTKKIPAKTSVVFTLPNTPGALYKALACFSLRDIDFSKIESRPTSASLLTFLKFRMRAEGDGKRAKSMPRFRYCFYLDFLDSENNEAARNALHHLREQADFCRILGSYPQKSRLVGPVKEKLKELDQLALSGKGVRTELSIIDESVLKDDDAEERKLNIGIVGFGNFGRFLAQKMVDLGHKVSCTDLTDKSPEADAMNVEYHPPYSLHQFFQNLDVVILSVPLIHLQDLLESQLPMELLQSKLIVETCPLSAHPKSLLLRHLPPTADILSTNALFGPSPSNPNSWENGPFLYEKVRIRDKPRCDSFLSIFSRSRCQMTEMAAETSDAYCANAEFVTHMLGRMLQHDDILPPTPVVSREYASLLDMVEMTQSRTFDFFYGLWEFNPDSQKYVDKLRDSLAFVEKRLAAKEAHLAARREVKMEERGRLLEECKMLMREVARGVKGEMGGDVITEREKVMMGGREMTDKGSSAKVGIDKGDTNIEKDSGKAGQVKKETKGGSNKDKK